MPKERISSGTIGGNTEQSTVDVAWGWSLDAPSDAGVSVAVVVPEAPTYVAYLDRDGLNRLIQILRKARGRVYGSDA